MKTSKNSNLEKFEKYTEMFKNKHSYILDNKYPKELVNIIEKYIEIYADGYCMDVKKERRKLSMSIYNLLCMLNNKTQ